MRFKALIGAAMALMFSSVVWAQQEIKVSYQPALYWSLPYLF